MSITFQAVPLPDNVIALRHVNNTYKHTKEKTVIFFKDNASHFRYVKTYLKISHLHFFRINIIYCISIADEKSPAYSRG